MQEYTYQYVTVGQFGMTVGLPHVDVAGQWAGLSGAATAATIPYPGQDSYQLLQYTVSRVRHLRPAVANIYGTGVTDTIYPLATDTTYVTASGDAYEHGQPRNAHDQLSYDYYPGTLQPESVVTTLPAVPTDEGGSGVAAQTVDSTTPRVI